VIGMLILAMCDEAPEFMPDLDDPICIAMVLEEIERGFTAREALGNVFTVKMLTDLVASGDIAFETIGRILDELEDAAMAAVAARAAAKEGT